MCEGLLRLAGENLAIAGAVGVIWSFLVELFPQFDQLSPVAKRWVMLGLCLGTPLVALFLAAKVFGCEVVIGPATIAVAIAAACAAFAGSQIAHMRQL